MAPRFETVSNANFEHAGNREGWPVRLCCKVGLHVAEWLDAEGSQVVSNFKGRHFEGEIVLWAVR